MTSSSLSIISDGPLSEAANVPTASSERPANSVHAADAREITPAAAQRIVEPEAIALPKAELPQPTAIHTDVLLSAAIRAARAEAGTEPPAQGETSSRPDGSPAVPAQSTPSATPSGPPQPPRAGALAADVPRDPGVEIPRSAEWGLSGTNGDSTAEAPPLTDGGPRSGGDSASAGRTMVPPIPSPGSGPERVGVSDVTSSDNKSMPARASDDAARQPFRAAEATAVIPDGQPLGEEPSDRLPRMWPSLVDDDVVVTRHTAGGQARPSLQVAAAPAEDAPAEAASTPTREGALRPTEPALPSPPAAASEPTPATRGAAAAEPPRQAELTSQAGTDARPAAGDVPPASGADSSPPARPVAQSDAPVPPTRDNNAAATAPAVTRGNQGVTPADVAQANSVASAGAAAAVRPQPTTGQVWGVLQQPRADAEPVLKAPDAAGGIFSAPRISETPPPDSQRGAFDTYAAVREVGARPNPPAPQATAPPDSGETQPQATTVQMPQASHVARAADGPTDGDSANPAAGTAAQDSRRPADRPAQVVMPAGDYPAPPQGRANTAVAASQPPYWQTETSAPRDTAGRAQPAAELQSSDHPLPMGTRNEPSATQALAGQTDAVGTPQDRRPVGPTPAQTDEAPAEQPQPQPQSRPTPLTESKQVTQDAHAAREIARPDAGPIAANTEGHAQREAAHLSPAPPPTAPQVVEQIARAARAQLDGDHTELVVRLDPPTLGTVHMRVVSQGAAMTAHLQVSTEASRELLSANLPALKEALAAAGLDIGHVSVGVGAQHQQGAAAGQPRQPHWHDQRLTAQADNGGGSLAAALRGAAHAGGRLFDAFA